jgi:NADH-quinone oxidoreductase subunit N
MDAGALQFSVLAPIGFVAVGAMVVLMGEVLLSPSRAGGDGVAQHKLGTRLAMLATVALGLAIYAAAFSFSKGTHAAFNPGNPMIQLDALSSWSMVIVGVGSLLSVWLSITYLPALHIDHGEYYALLLLATAGMFLMVSAVDMITVFMGLELMSIPIYALAGFDRRKLRSNESGLKYFMIGAFASAILLYGMALLYGATGHTDFQGIREGFDAASPLAMAGLALVIVGFAFKISSVPFHQWTPDVYEGAPTSVTAFMSVTVKASAFVILLRFLVLSLPESPERLTDLFWVLSALTMIVGNFMAVIQTNVKRLLAYSSIAHAGYVLVGFVAGTAEAHAAVLFYLTLFLVALAGMPGTAGFMGKFYVFSAAVKPGYVNLAILGVLTSVVSVYYYMRVPVAMYMNEARDEEPAEASTSELLVLALCALAVIYLGIFPNHDPIFGAIRALEFASTAVAPIP